MAIGSESRNNLAVIMHVVNAAGALVEREHLDIRPALMTINAADNQRFVPASGDNWSRIGWKKLGDGRRWWIVADYSEIVDPFTDLQPVTQNTYLAQLAATATGTVTQLSLRSAADAGKFQRGMTIYVEDLNPSNPVSFTTTVIGVDTNNLIVTITPVTLVGSIPFALSRVSSVAQLPVQLVCPSPNRAFFNALNFDNPLSTLVG
jgi:hypothetical protein